MYVLGLFSIWSCSWYILMFNWTFPDEVGLPTKRVRTSSTSITSHESSSDHLIWTVMSDRNVFSSFFCWCTFLCKISLLLVFYYHWSVKFVYTFELLFSLEDFPQLLRFLRSLAILVIYLRDTYSTKNFAEILILL